MQTKERKTWLVYTNTGDGWKLSERVNDTVRLAEIKERSAGIKGVGVKVKEAPGYVPDMRQTGTGRPVVVIDDIDPYEEAHRQWKEFLDGSQEKP